jgi:chondroitin 4-sulfotransferase 11
MIDDKHKFIFIHIPKTGGTSIEKAFKKRIKGGHKHLTLFDYENELKTEIEKYFVFSVIRNPWDRLVSYWKYRQGKRHAPIDGKLNEFDKWLKFISSLDLNNLNGKTARGNIPDFRMGLDLQFNSLLNKKNEININLIRFENLQEDFNTICDKIGIPQQQLPHKNKTKHKHYTEYYDEETKQIVAEKYAKDIECFGYEF